MADQPEVGQTRPEGGSMRHTVSNTAALLMNDMVNRAIIFFLYALIARYLGGYEFGQLSLTLTIFFLLQSLGPIGIKILLIRDVAKDPGRTGYYLTSGSVVSFLTSILALGLLALFLMMMRYTADTTRIILLVSLSLIPYSLSAVCEAILQAHEQIRWITAANVPISLLRGAAAFYLLWAGRDLDTIGWLFLVSFIGTWVLEILFAIRYAGKPTWEVSFPFYIHLARAAVPFLGLQAIIALSGSVFPIALSKFSNMISVGLFNSANQLMAPILLVTQSTALSLFPRLCRRYSESREKLRVSVEGLTEILMAFALPCVILLAYFARELLLLLYERPEFIAAETAVRVMCITLIFRAFTSVFGRALLAIHWEKNLTLLLIIETGTSILFSVLLIPRWGVLGASIAVVLVGLVDLVFHIVPLTRHIGSFEFSRVTWKPFLAGGGMVLILVGLNQTSIHWIFCVLISGVLYLGLWTALSILSMGGWRQMMQQFQGAK